MNVIRHTDADFAERLGQLAAPSSLFDPIIEERARAIVDAVKTRGDAALLELTERFDGAKLTAEQLQVTPPELLAASLRADKSLRQAVAMSARNIEKFSRKALRKNWTARNAQ